MDFDGKALLEDSHPVDVTTLASKVYLDWPLKKLTNAGAVDSSRVYVEAELTKGGSEISHNITYLVPVKEVYLKPAMLKVETSPDKGDYKIRVTSPVLARSVYLSFRNLNVKVSDNYFNLLPGVTVEITAIGPYSLDQLKAQLRVRTLQDAFSSGGQR